MYVVDSDVCIDYMRGKTDAVNLLKSLGAFYVTTITVGELFFGAYNAEQRDKLLNVLKDYLSSVAFLKFELWDSIKFGQIKAGLKKEGAIIDDFDIMNAAIALSYGFTLVTRNVKHYRRIKELKLLEPPATVSPMRNNYF
jgi:tRNA(fMet)-specific endonuclease VapC